MTLLEEMEVSVQTAAERTGPAVVGLGRCDRAGARADQLAQPPSR